MKRKMYANTDIKENVTFCISKFIVAGKDPQEKGNIVNTWSDAMKSPQLNVRMVLLRKDALQNRFHFQIVY